MQQPQPQPGPWKLFLELAFGPFKMSVFTRKGPYFHVHTHAHNHILSFPLCQGKGFRFSRNQPSTAESREDSHNRDQFINQQLIRNQNESILNKDVNTIDNDFLCWKLLKRKDIFPI